jgi:RiboL-PSP-HEPN
MPRYTAAYQALLQRLSEIEALNRLARRHSVKLGVKQDAATANALCRASIVLLSSHLEGYVENLADVILQRIFQRALSKQKLAPRFLYYFSKDLLDELYDTRDPDKIAMKMKVLFQRDGDIWSTNGAFGAQLPSDRFIADFSNPSFEKIKRFVARFGYNDYTGDLGHLLKANYQPCINMVDNVINQRNKIAHGDAVATATPGDVADMLRLMRQFCRATDDVVCNWFKKTGCLIR